MSAPDAALAELPVDEPSWLYDPVREPPVDHAEAARFLAGLDEEDFGVFVLAYGLGMRFGVVSQTLGLDPALVVWRLRRALERWRREAPEGRAPRRLEEGLTDLLRAERPQAPSPPRGLPSWRAHELLRELETQAQERLAARLEAPARRGRVRPGVGVGLGALILLVAAVLALFGAVRDAPPLREGRRLMAEQRYAEARAAFLRLGDSVEGRKRRALCYVAEGDFARAFELFSDVEVLASLGQFAPHERPLAPQHAADGGRALLPRGRILGARPRFVVSGEPTGELRVTLAAGAAGAFRTDTAGAAPADAQPDVYRVPYPDAWRPLASAEYAWQLADDPDSRAHFEVIPKDHRSAILDHFEQHLHFELAGAPARFLKAQLYLNQELLMDAGHELAGLSRAFPGAEYPRHRLAEVSAALGVDPSAFAR